MDTDPFHVRFDRATNRHGIVTASRLRANGVSSDAMALRVRHGTYVRFGSGVYVPARVSKQREVLLAAALERAGASSCIGLGAAAHLLVGWQRGQSGLDVLATRYVRPVDGSDVRFHRVRELGEDDVVMVDGFPVSTPWRTWRDLTRSLTPHQLVALACELEYHHGLDVSDLADWFGLRPRARGRRSALRALELHAAGCRGTRSSSEDRFLELSHESGWDEPVVNTRGATGVPTVEADFVFARAGIVVEIDGRSHAFFEQRRSDGERDALLRHAGWRVERIAAIDVWRRPALVRRRVEAAMRRTRSR